LVIDGQNAAYRLAAMLPDLTTKNHKRVEVIYSFLRLIHGMIEDFEPDRVIVCWDKGVPRLRMELFPDYKRERHAKRDAAGGDFLTSIESQLREVKKLLPLLGVATMEMKDIEADDVIANCCEVPGFDKVVVSNDWDMYQLIRPGVDVYSPLKKIRYTVENFPTYFRVTPQVFLHIRALSGDETDEIPPCTRGIGPKTAEKIMALCEIFADVWEPHVRRKFPKLFNGPEPKRNAYRNLQLMDLSLTISPTAIRRIRASLEMLRPVDKLAVFKYFRAHEFESLLKFFSVWLQPFEKLNDAKD
jgi:5'-3' exonuclease